MRVFTELMLSRRFSSSACTCGSWTLTGPVWAAEFCSTWLFSSSAFWLSSDEMLAFNWLTSG